MRKTVKKTLIPHEGNDFRPYILRTAGVLFVLVVVLIGISFSNIHQYIVRTSDFISAVLPGVLTDLTNASRRANNLSELTVNPKLVEAARLKAEDMALKSYFSHYSPEGYAPWYWIKKAGYEFYYAGENLAIDFDDSAAVDAAWMNSPGHRANILNGNYSEIGIATAQGYYDGHPTLFVVEMFASPAQKPKVAEVTATPVKTVSKPVEQPRPSEIVEIASSTIIGESQKQSFFAVMDINAKPAEISQRIAGVTYSTWTERLVTSPSKILTVIYGLLLAILSITVVEAARRKHEPRLRNIGIALGLIAIVIISFYFQQTTIFANIFVL